MKRFIYISRGLLVLLPLIVLLSLGRMVVDWVEYSQIAGPFADAPARSYDGIVWQEDDGAIVIDYVFPDSPADNAGLEAGDAFYMLEYQQYFTMEDVQRAVEGIPPGEARTYHVRRDGQFAETTVTLTRYPTFLYPLSTALWQFAVWGFVLGAFFHVLGLLITAPLARRSVSARFSLGLITLSGLWFFSNAVRLLMVDILGPPEPLGTYATIFQALTFIGLAGWIGFPALLFHKVLRNTFQSLRLKVGRILAILYLPVILLGGAVTLAAFFGSIGPFTMDSLVAPILFYACCYIASAGAVVLLYYFEQLDQQAELSGAWSWQGSFVLFVTSLLLALSVQGAVPLFGAVTDVVAGWVIVSAQLLSIVPVILVTVATLRSGKMNEVLSRVLTYVTMLGLIFFAFIGGISLLDRYVPHASFTHNVLSGIYVVFLLLLFEQLARRVHVYASQFFTTERQQRQKRLSRFQERMRTILDPDSLVRQTIHQVGEAFDLKTARLFLITSQDAEHWVTGAYNPQPPYLTERVVKRVWPYIQREGRVWSQNPELNESTLPEGRATLLRDRGASLAIPIMGDGEPIGLMVLGDKRSRRSMWNLADLDLLRAMSGQLALAVERLNLVAREKQLVRESAEAELVALRSQINPHFLFNALNTILALITERPNRAEETVEHLASIFRYTLKAGSEPFVPLKEEIDLVNHYLQIEKARFGERLSIKLTLPSSLREFPVPAFAVQTLVENAVKHGIAPKRYGGTVEIRACLREKGGVRVEISDTGVGIPMLFEEEAPTTDRFYGLGLANITSRLQQLYNQSGLLRIESDPDEGTTATILLPSKNRHTNGVSEDTFSQSTSPS